MKCAGCERKLFVIGKLVLGKGAGGLIVKLKEKLGIEAACTALEMAADKQDPREYIGAVIRTDQKRPPLTDEEFARLKAKYDAKVARTS